MAQRARTHAIRPATQADAVALGQVHAASWLEAYAKILPTSTLSALSVEGRRDMWARILADSGAINSTSVYLAERAGAVAGFCACGAQRSRALEDQGYTGEITALYVLQAYQRQGIGAAMMRAMALDLSERAFGGASLWVLRENAAALRFYQHLGGTPVGTKEEVLNDTVLVEIAYGWKDLTRLHRAAS